MLLLMFTAGANRYAVDVARVVEVLPRVELRLVPHAPAVLAGLLGYRGSIVPVLDLGLLLGAAPCQDYLSTRIIVVNDTAGDHYRRNQHYDASHDQIGETQSEQKAAPTFLGLIAEHVSDLTYAQPEQVILTPVFLPQAPYLGAIVQTDQGIVQLISVEHVRSASLLSSFPGENPASDWKLDPPSLIA